MLISTCPRCHESFRIPEGQLSANDRAECPWCAEEFSLEEVINRLPPLLKIISADHDATQPVAQAVGADASPSLDVESFDLTGDSSPADETVAFVEQNEFSLDTNDGDQTATSVVASAPSVQTKRRKSSGGGLRSIIGFAAGGLLALPIAGGILWGLGLGPFADGKNPFATRVASKPMEITRDRPINIPKPAAAVTDPADDQSSLTAPVQSGGSLLAQPTQQNPTVSDSVANNDSGPSASSEPETTNTLEVVEVGASAESDALVSTIKRASKMIKAIDNLKQDDSRRGEWLIKTYEKIALAGELAESKGSVTSTTGWISQIIQVDR